MLMYCLANVKLSSSDTSSYLMWIIVLSGCLAVLLIIAISKYELLPHIWRLVTDSEGTYRKRIQLISWARAEIKNLPVDTLDEIADKLSGDHDASVIGSEEKVKILRASSEDELNQLWKKFKSRKSKEDYYLLGDVISIKKKKIKVVGNEYQINVFYKETIVLPGKDQEYHQLIKHIDSLRLYKKLEDLIDDLYDLDNSLKDILTNYPEFERVIVASR